MAWRTSPSQIFNKTRPNSSFPTAWILHSLPEITFIMSLLDLFEFVFRFALGASSAATWTWVIITFIVFIFLIGSLWGRAWNKEWSLSRHGGFFATVLIFAVFAAYSVFNLRTIAGMEEWFKQQSATLPRSISDSSRLKRSVIVETWSRLEPKKGQQDLTPPDQSGDQVRLNTPEDAIVLASVAAEAARSSLHSKPPFIFGIPLDTKSPNDIASETVDALKLSPTAFPKTVGGDNEWTATAATLQVNHALDTAIALLKPKLADLKTACLWLLGLSVLIPFVFGAIRALEDIKVNPKP